MEHDHSQTSPRRDVEWSDRSQELSPRHMHDEEEEDRTNGSSSTRHFRSTLEELPPLAPERTEPTLKERLVERERQARVETERARLKRQFALLSNGGSIEEMENGSVVGTVGEGSSIAAPPTDVLDDDDGDEEGMQATLGYAMERFLSEGTVAPNDEVKKKIEPGVVMERFLAEPVQLEPDENADDHAESHSSEAKIPAQQLNGLGNMHDDAVLLVSESMGEKPDTVTHDGSELEANAGSMRSYSTVSEHDLIIRDHPTPSDHGDDDDTEDVMESHFHLDRDVTREPDSPRGQLSLAPSSQQSSLDLPMRVFRLTEAEIQEMAAIEEASIGNAPPSDREEELSESSLVGDLVGDFGGSGIEHHGDFSERTHTTVLESISMTSAGGDRSEHRSEQVADHHSLDGIETASVSSHLNLSPGATSDGSVSVTAMPPSEIAREEAPLSLIPDDDTGIEPNLSDPDHYVQETDRFVGNVESFDSDGRNGSNILDMPSFEENDTLNSVPSFQDNGGPRDLEAAAVANVGVVNRQLRPGKVEPYSRPPRLPSAPDSVGSGMKRTKSLPDKIHIMLDGFDFDKDKFECMPATPRSGMVDSFSDLPGDELWPPIGAVNGSPFRKESLFRQDGNGFGKVPSYASPRGNGPKMAVDYYGGGAHADLPHFAHDRDLVTEKRGSGVSPRTKYGSANLMSSNALKSDSPFLPAIIEFPEQHQRTETRPLLLFQRELRNSEATSRANGQRHSVASLADIADLVDSIFSSVRSDSTASVEAENNECDIYRASSVLARAFPERFFALLVTLLVEVPVLLMISGGSDRLCMLIGRRRYQLMMGFLPLSSAISGNCGLQASTLTTRAISHRHVTKNSYLKWLRTEVCAAFFLGLGMGIVLGTYGYFASGMDFPFGLTIFTAQFVSILTAGLTGTLAPLLFSFIFHRDSGKWGGPLETAIQDIVGSFAMVVMSYRLLILFGPMEIAPNDVCGTDM